MVAVETEVSEADAAGAVKAIYDDIKATLRVPVVPLVFRVLATEPDYLAMAWRALKPNAQTAFFEDSSDHLRTFLVKSAAAWAGAPRPPDGSGALPVLKVFQYLDPKLLLAVAALRSATSGSQPKLTELPRDAKRQMVPGVPPAAGSVEMVDPEQASAQVQAVFDDIRIVLHASVIGDEFRALAFWPEYLESAWHAWKTVAGQPAYLQLERALGRTLEEVLTALPFRLNLYPHALRHAGLSELQIDAVQEILGGFYGLQRAMAAAVSYWTMGAEGQDQAARSPFPPQLL
jgi:hypothetical protein